MSVQHTAPRRSGSPPKIAPTTSWNIDQVLNAIEAISKTEIDQDVEGFVSNLAFTLQKCPEDMREYLFLQICTLVFNKMYPRRNTAPHPPPSPLRGAEPHLMSTPRPGPSSVPTDHGDQSCIPNWGPPPLLISLSGQECMGSEHPQLSMVGLTEKAMQMRCCLRGRFLLRTCKLWNFVHRKQCSFFMSSCIQFVYLFDTSFCFVSFCLS